MDMILVAVLFCNCMVDGHNIVQREAEVLTKNSAGHESELLSAGDESLDGGVVLESYQENDGDQQPALYPFAADNKTVTPNPKTRKIKSTKATKATTKKTKATTKATKATTKATTSPVTKGTGTTTVTTKGTTTKGTSVSASTSTAATSSTGSATSSTKPTTISPAACGATPEKTNLVSLTRMYSPYLTTNKFATSQSEVLSLTRQGYNNMGSAGKISKSPTDKNCPYLIPIYHVYSSYFTTDYYTTNTDLFYAKLAQGWRNLGVLGYAVRSAHLCDAANAIYEFFFYPQGYQQLSDLGTVYNYYRGIPRANYAGGISFTTW